MVLLYAVVGWQVLGGILKAVGALHYLVVHQVRMVAQLLQCGYIAERRQTCLHLGFACYLMIINY